MHNIKIKESKQKSEEIKSYVHKEVKSDRTDRNTNDLSEFQKTQNTANNIKKKAFTSFTKNLNSETEVIKTNNNNNNNYSSSSKSPNNKSAEKNMYTVHSSEYQRNPSINYYHNHNRKLESITSNKAVTSEKPSQDEIKEFLLKVKEIIPINEFKKFIEFIKQLTVKNIIYTDKIIILQKVRFIFRNNQQIFDHFEKLLLIRD